MTTIWDTAPGPHPPTDLPTAPPTEAEPDDGWWESTTPPPLPPTPPPPAHKAGRQPEPKKRGHAGKIVAVVAGAAVLVGAGFLGRDLVQPAAAPTATPAPAAAATPAAQGVEQVAKTLSPAVVQIQTSDGLGSGVVYDASGLVLTNAHVVGSASTVKVTLSGGKQAQGQVLGADTSADIAVVKIDPNGITVAPLATETVQVGESVAAVGSPFGLQGTVTAGIVSATDRPVDGELGVSTKMIQTDAPINPGNSGGALANTKGEVIGINTAIFSQKGENNGIGFAIPIATAKSVADGIASGEGSAAQPGSGAQPSTPQQGQPRTAPRGNGGSGNGGGNSTPSNPKQVPTGRAVLGITLQPSADGAVVAQVQSGSPAADAGLKSGDIITGVDGQGIDSAASLQAAIASYQPGEQVTLEVQRGSQQGTVDVTLAATSN